jgi:hypothetical protein
MRPFAAAVRELPELGDLYEVLDLLGDRATTQVLATVRRDGVEFPIHGIVIGSKRADAPTLLEAGCEVRQLDLCDPPAVWDFADSVEAEDRPLHVLINCADGLFPPNARAACGWERGLGSIHLGPLLLANLLSDQMVRTMARDAMALAKAEGNGRRGRRAPGGGSTGSSNDMTLGQPLQLTARPFPHPLGRILTVGMGANRPRGMLETATTLPSPRYHPLGARARAMRANALCAVHMAREFRDAALDDGSFIEVWGWAWGGGVSGCQGRHAGRGEGGVQRWRRLVCECGGQKMISTWETDFCRA